MTNKGISKLWIQGQNSTCLVIPRKIAKDYGLTDEDHVSVEATKDGILVRRVEI